MKQVNLEFLGFPDYDVTEDGRVWSHRANRYLVKTMRGLNDLFIY